MKQYYPYEAFREDTKHLLKQLKSFSPEGILGIARGGLTLSQCLAEGLNIRNVQSIRTELYDDTQKRETFSLQGHCDFSNIARVLVVDDIADSGETLQKVMHYLTSEFPDVEFRSATLFYKKSSCYRPHFWIHEAHNWIEFFWERDFLEA